MKTCGIYVALNLLIQIWRLLVFSTHATALTVTAILDSYDHFSTVTTIAPGQLRSYRRCRVCKLRSYCESFTSPYLGKKCTNQQSMARKIETDDVPLLCTDTIVQSCVQASQSALPFDIGLVNDTAALRVDVSIETIPH